MLCFPFLFRGALDVGAIRINGAMKMAAVRAIADLAVAGTSDEVRSAYSGQNLRLCDALQLIRARLPDLEVEGEMHADLALSEEMRNTR